MKNTEQIIDTNNGQIDFEDITCVLNPVQASDLEAVLRITKAERRLDVALAFCNITLAELSTRSGFGNIKFDTTAYRWFNHKHRIPLGAAFRISRVLGVSAEVLFESPVWLSEKSEKN